LAAAAAAVTVAVAVTQLGYDHVELTDCEP
jgi:hypothetical protein